MYGVGAEEEATEVVEDAAEEASSPAVPGAAEALADAEERRRRRRRRSILGTVLLLIAVVGTFILVYNWTQSQYYVSISDGKVAIYQGIPQSIGPWQLSHAVEVSNVALSDLAPVDRQRLDTPVLRSSRADIDSYIEGLRRSVVHPDTPSSTTPQSGAPQSGEAQSGAQSGGAS